MRRGQLPACPCRRVRADGPKRSSRRNAAPTRGGTPHRPSCQQPEPPGPRTETRPGARAQTSSDNPVAAPVKRFALGPAGRPSGDRAPPPALNRVITGRIRNPQPRQPRRRACQHGPAQIRWQQHQHSRARRCALGSACPAPKPISKRSGRCLLAGRARRAATPRQTADSVRS